MAFMSRFITAAADNDDDDDVVTSFNVDDVRGSACDAPKPGCCRAADVDARKDWHPVYVGYDSARRGTIMLSNYTNN